MRRLMMCVLLAAGLNGCASAVEKECQKAVECGEWKGSEDECVTSMNELDAALGSKEKCKWMLERNTAAMECTSDLSCDERNNLPSTSCAAAYQALMEVEGSSDWKECTQ